MAIIIAVMMCFAAIAPSPVIVQPAVEQVEPPVIPSPVQSPLQASPAGLHMIPPVARRGVTWADEQPGSAQLCDYRFITPRREPANSLPSFKLLHKFFMQFTI